MSIILRNYHSRSSVVRDDEAIKTLVETEDIWAKIRICRVAKTSEIRKQSRRVAVAVAVLVVCLRLLTESLSSTLIHTPECMRVCSQTKVTLVCSLPRLTAVLGSFLARVTHSPILFVYSLLQTTWNRGLPRRIPKQTAGRWRPQQKDRNYLGKSLAKRQSHARTHNGKLMEGLPRNSL